MSLSFLPVEAVTCLDPRMDLQQKREFAVMKGSSRTSWKQYTTSSVSQSSIQWSCNPPSNQVVVDRKVFMYLPIRLTFTSVPLPGDAVFQAQYDAPRAFPIANIIETLQVTINNQSVSINLADVAQAMLHYNTDIKLKSADYSMTPNMTDAYMSYDDGLITNRNPLGLYGDGIEGCPVPRGGFQNIRIIANPVQAVGQALTLTGIVDVAFCEPIFLSPFYWGCSNAPGFYGVSTLDFNVNFIGQTAMATRCWSHASSRAVLTATSAVFGGLSGGPTSFAATTGNQPTLLFQYLTPQESYLIPHDTVLAYPYADIQRYPIDIGSVSSGATTTINSNNIQISTIPRRIYVFARERNSDLYSNTAATDTFLQINNLSIQWQNQNGLLSSASQQQLFQMSKKNHCNLNWTEWSGGPVLPNQRQFTLPITYVGTVGSIACIEMASDIGLDSLEAPGKLTQSMIQIQATVTNLANRALNVTLYLVTVLDGTFTIMGGQATQNLGVITSKDILDADAKPHVNYRDLESCDGGDFLSGLKSVFGRIQEFLKKTKAISKVASHIDHPLAKAVHGVAEHYGYGSDGMIRYQDYVHQPLMQQKRGGLENGDLLIGGKMMKKKDLRKRLDL